MKNQNTAPSTIEQPSEDEASFDREKTQYVIEKVEKLFGRMKAVRGTPSGELTPHLDLSNSYEISTRLAEARENGDSSLLDWRSNELSDGIVITEVNKDGDLSQTRVALSRMRVMGRENTGIFFKRNITSNNRQEGVQLHESELTVTIGGEDATPWGDFKAVTYERRTNEEGKRTFSLPQVEKYDGGDIPEGQLPRVVAAFINKLESVVKSEEAAADNTERQKTAIAGVLGETARKG